MSLSQTTEYCAWRNMLRRCDNVNCADYANYGGRGIKVCKEWRDFANFLADIGPRPSSKHSLDRVDNDGDYKPENVRWATVFEQNGNTRSNRTFRIGENKLHLAAVARAHNVPVTRLKKRLNLGWPLEKAISQQSRQAPR